MTKTRKLYKLRHYKTRRNKIKRNKIKRNKKSLRKGLRKRRKTKKLRGGSISYSNINKELGRIKKKLDDNLTEQQLIALKDEIDKLNNEEITYNENQINTTSDKYNSIKTKLKKYGIIVDTKLETLSETPKSQANVKDLISIYEDDKKKSENKNNSNTLECLNNFKTRFSEKMREAKVIIDLAKKCGKSDV